MSSTTPPPYILLTTTNNPRKLHSPPQTRVSRVAFTAQAPLSAYANRASLLATSQPIPIPGSQHWIDNIARIPLREIWPEGAPRVHHYRDDVRDYCCIGARGGEREAWHGARVANTVQRITGLSQVAEVVEPKRSLYGWDDDWDGEPAEDSHEENERGKRFWEWAKRDRRAQWVGSEHGEDEEDSGNEEGVEDSDGSSWDTISDDLSNGDEDAHEVSSRHDSILADEWEYESKDVDEEGAPEDEISSKHDGLLDEGDTNDECEVNASKNDASAKHDSTPNRDDSKLANKKSRSEGGVLPQNEGPSKLHRVFYGHDASSEGEREKSNSQDSLSPKHDSVFDKDERKDADEKCGSDTDLDDSSDEGENLGYLYARRKYD
ncbi:hypothetical protein K458DRAFT_483348 [Lentithecium fluviatile CBS 122367]|uniref:Uncharacterized protein n=1 Tax=Lentithecium fluviatile CBS 122367 TaxID=1168545 RepID=A0A6G1JMD7_9PLEO|nr:hypothetical protein K458DRAFT_483348 [Lentithecium fluviatile CBS 122367]